MNKAEEYKADYEQCFKVYDAQPEDIIDSLVEDMIEYIRELKTLASREHQVKRIQQEASSRTSIQV